MTGPTHSTHSRARAHAIGPDASPGALPCARGAYVYSTAKVESSSQGSVDPSGQPGGLRVRREAEGMGRDSDKISDMRLAARRVAVHTTASAATIGIARPRQTGPRRSPPRAAARCRGWGCRG